MSRSRGRAAAARWKPSKISDVLPDFARELEAGLRDAGEEALADSVDRLRIASPCGCGESLCESFHVAPVPRSDDDTGRSILVEIEGVVVVDTYAEKIVFVEVLYRGDLRATIREYFEAARRGVAGR